MLGDPLTLSLDGSFSPTPGGPDDPTFSTVSIANGQAVRINADTELSLPEYLTVRHSQQGGKGDVLVDRHNIQLSRSERDEGTGRIYVHQTNFSFVVPRHTLFTEADVRRHLTMLMSLVGQSADTNLAKILRGEV